MNRDWTYVRLHGGGQNYVVNKKTYDVMHCHSRISAIRMRAALNSDPKYVKEMVGSRYAASFSGNKEEVEKLLAEGRAYKKYFKHLGRKI